MLWWIGHSSDLVQLDISLRPRGQRGGKLSAGVLRVVGAQYWAVGSAFIEEVIVTLCALQCEGDISVRLINTYYR